MFPKIPKPQLKDLDILTFNRQAERAFCELVTRWIEASEGQALDVSWVIREAAFELDISPETAKRYLLKHSAQNASFVVADRCVRLRAGDPAPAGGGQEEADPDPAGGGREGPDPDPDPAGGGRDPGRDDIPPHPTRQCYACGGLVYWLAAAGTPARHWVCTRCHPPVGRQQVLVYTVPAYSPFPRAGLASGNNRPHPGGPE